MIKLLLIFMLIFLFCEEPNKPFKNQCERDRDVVNRKKNVYYNNRTLDYYEDWQVFKKKLKEQCPQLFD